MKVIDPVSGVYGEAWSTIKCRGEAFDGGLLSISTSCKGDNCSACRGVGVRRICAHNACQEYGCSLDSCFEIIPGPLFEVIK